MHAAPDIADLIAGSESVGAVARVIADVSPGAAAWLVGGAVRDLLAGRAVKDVDLAVQGDAGALARKLREQLGGDVFSLSDRFGTWRVLPSGGGWQIDLTALRGATIEEDLAQRDFTINAMAVELTAVAALVDPLDGAGDVERRRLRVLGPQAFSDDPLRPLRLPRFVAGLGFEPDPETARLAAEFAPQVTEAAPERAFAELRELMRAPDPIAGLRWFEDLGLAEALMPELMELRGVEQSVYHHLDAHDHTFEVLQRLLEVEQDLPGVFGEDAGRLAHQLAAPLADEMTRGDALRWAALLHDIAKSRTRTVFDDGRVGFPGHDRRGAEMIRAICARLHTSDKFARFVADLTLHHLRLGFLVYREDLSAREIYRYLKECEPVEVEVGVLSVADRSATRGRKADRAISLHLELARELNTAALDWRARRGEPPLVRGDELARALGIDPGPRLGELLDAIEEERYVGAVTTAAEAVAFARRAL